MATACEHLNSQKFQDMPLADPETFDFLGRFDVTVCIDCDEILTKKPTTYPEENTISATPEGNV